VTPSERQEAPTAAPLERLAAKLQRENDALRAKIVTCHGFQHRGAGTACICVVCEDSRKEASRV
jgi:hypothetical protein